MEKTLASSTDYRFYWNEIYSDLENFNKLLDSNFSKLTSQQVIFDAFGYFITDCIQNKITTPQALKSFINETFNPFVQAL